MRYGLRRSITLELWELVAEAMRKTADDMRGPPSFIQFLKKARIRLERLEIKPFEAVSRPLQLLLDLETAFKKAGFA